MDDRIFTMVVLGVLSLLVFSGCVDEERTEVKEADSLVVGGKSFTLDELFSSCELRSVDGGSGVALDDVVKKAGVSNPETCTYTLIASDNYQKTVKWEDMEKGVLTNESLAVFPHLPKMYWVRDVVEVKQNG